MSSSTEFNVQFIDKIPPQQQNKQPGIESEMKPLPVFDHEAYRHADKLKGKVAIITGGDSGIGRAVAVAFAKEGADIGIMYLNEHDDAQKTKEVVEKEGRKCVIISGDIADEEFCKKAVKDVVDKLGTVDILVNNAAGHSDVKNIQEITKEKLERVFAVNVFSMFYLSKACVPYMKEGSSIINTASVVAYKGHKNLIDYSATKGAVVTFTRSLALAFADSKIRVNGVAPGPIWTPLIPSTFTPQEVSEFGQNTEWKRPGQPVELAPAYVFLASADSSYITGEMIHVNGGHIMNT